MTGLHDALVIARRELLERIKSRWFVAITLLGPLGIVAMIVIPALLLSNGEGTKIDIVDRTGAIGQPLAEALTALKWKPHVVEDPATPDDVEMQRIRDKQINGFFTIPPDGLDQGRIIYRGDNGSNQIVKIKLGLALQAVIQVERGKRAQISSDKLAQVLRPIRFDPQQTSGKNKATSGESTFFLGYALAYLVFLTITLYAVSVMRSVVQEKTSRVMELMIATIQPRALMAGKILGVGGAGLLQVGVWLTIGALALSYHDQVLGLFGAATGGGSSLPPLHVDVVVIALAFFVFGYFFYAAMYAAVGAMVSSEQDTQQVQAPITILLLIGFVSVTAVSGDPRGTPATIVTMLPCWSPLLMPMRYLLGGASLGEVAISLVILIASTALVARAAAKIYRVGVLMYGKRPGFGELVRWLRY